MNGSCRRKEEAQKMTKGKREGIWVSMYGGMNGMNGPGEEVSETGVASFGARKQRLVLNETISVHCPCFRASCTVYYYIVHPYCISDTPTEEPDRRVWSRKEISIRPTKRTGRRRNAFDWLLRFALDIRQGTACVLCRVIWLFLKLLRVTANPLP